MTRILLADDHVAVRDGIRAVLADQRDLEVVGEAVDGPSTVAAARTLRPDLIVLDNSMPGLSGLDVARMLRDELPWTGIVMLTMDPGIRDLALAAGATAFVTKDAPSDELILAIRASALALVVRRNLNDLQPRWRRVLELLVGSRAATETQIHNALGQRANGESFVMTLLRLGLLGQPDLADVLARASQTPLVSLAPYPEVAAPIDPTEQRLSSPRLLDPVERAASRLLPLDVARPLGIVVIASDGREGVLAMADPLDDAALSEAERHTRLRLTRVTATLDDIQDALARAFSSAAPDPVVWTGKARGVVSTVMVIGFVAAVVFGAFFFLVRDALAPRFAFSLFALLCGLFFFLYALKYYVTIASVLLITLFGDPARFGRNGNGHATTGEAAIGGQNGNGLRADGHTKGNGHATGRHKEGYRTLRGENLSAGGAVVVTDPWQKIGEIRLPADRQPFVSIHLALYNESRVVERLLTACTAFDYENYEVIVADDSTDETVEKLKAWQNHPRVRIIHRSNRKGFKGGALQEALRRMNPKTEYVMVFDADFVPPADAIWHFLDYFGRLSKKNGNGHGANGHNGHGANGNGHGAPQNGDRLAVVQGYQWHMLNASENWITKGVRAEFSGSYVLERSGQELFGAMKMISGSVYMIRADVLRKLGWSTSITEDWELTIRLYLAGYKVLYTPYIQAPAECVSTVSRLIKQRMRWAEGHTYNVKKYFWPVLRSPNLTWQEKLEFVYYAPYYLQSVLFSVATLAWIVGVLILGQKLPMWGEVFGWSLVVSNALALPLMNLTGVLMEGSLRRDVFGLLSFIGLSWILVPFQAYASVKALFERREGGWVRTPKSGRVTEVLERFHLARLMPWELPKRKRGQSKASTGTGRFAAAAVVVLAAAGIITVGALSIRAAATSGTASETDLVVPALVGTGVPLAILALGWLRLHRRVTAVVLAFTLGLGTNVVFLAHAVPAAAVTDNSSVFTFRNTSSFGSHDMVQNYTPPTGTPATAPTSLSANWTHSFTSDAFTAGQTMNAGTAQADLYLENQPAGPTNDYVNGYTFFASSGAVNAITLNKITNQQSGDVIIAHLSIRGGTGVATITKPSASWNLVDRIDSGTSITLAVYSLVAGSSEPASYTWSWTGTARKSSAIMRNFAGVDTSAPVDGHGGATESSASTTHVAPSVNAAYANEMRVVGIADSSDGLCNTISGWNMSSLAGGGGSGASQAGISMYFATTYLPAGPTGTLTATCGNDIGATHQLTLKPTPTPSCTVTVTLKKQRPIWLRDYTTNAVENTTSITVTKPALAQPGDVLVLAIAYSSGGSSAAPTGFTIFSFTNGIVSFYHVVGASDPGPWTWTNNTSQSAIVAWLGAYVEVDNTTPKDPTVRTASTTATTTHTTSTTMSTANANEMLIVAWSVWANATWTPPVGMDEVVDIKNSTNILALAVDHAIQAQAGASGQKTAISSAAGNGVNIMFALNPSAATTLGTANITLGSLTTPTLQSVSISTSATTFATGERLYLDVSVPNDAANCGVRLSYDEASTPSKLTVATIVPEGIAALLLLAPALPIALRWWKRRRL